MPSTPYRWRKLSEDDRKAVLEDRLRKGHPTHSPKHIDSGNRHYHITAACFEHQALIGATTARMTDFSHRLLDTLNQSSAQIHAWVVLPNHYHVLIHSASVLDSLKALGPLHGSTSHQWNGEDTARGRQVWCKAAETAMKSDGHFHATVNYIHHNPVKHGYVQKWTEWPWSSAIEFLQTHSRAEMQRLWQTYPIHDYGQGWDDPDL
jgi:putative transposase